MIVERMRRARVLSMKGIAVVHRFFLHLQLKSSSQLSYNIVSANRPACKPTRRHPSLLVSGTINSLMCYWYIVAVRNRCVSHRLPWMLHFFIL